MDEQESPNQVTNSSLPTENVSSQPVTDYLKQVKPLQKHKKRRFIKFVIVSAILLIGAGVGGYFYLKNRASQQVVKQPLTEASEQPKIAINTTMTRYSSSQFALDFDHPSDWEVKDENIGGVLAVTSPNLSIPTTGGSVITGKIVLTIRGKNQKLPEFDAGNALAVMNSEKVAYTKPSSAQRGQTYLSFLNYPKSTLKTVIDGVCITGDSGYQKDQAIPKIDVQKIDPIISITFLSCDGACTKAIGITPEAWADANFGGILKKILQSLTIN